MFGVIAALFILCTASVHLGINIQKNREVAPLDPIVIFGPSEFPECQANLRLSFVNDPYWNTLNWRWVDACIKIASQGGGR